MTENQKVLIAALLSAIVETIQECGQRGVASSTVWLALSARVPSLSINKYQQMMGALVAAGKIKFSNDRYYAADLPTVN